MNLTATTSSSLAALSIDELRRRLADAITVTARGLYETALIFEALRQRGEPVEELRLTLAPYLPRIARGELAAEAVIGLAGFRTALDRVAMLPAAKQRELIDTPIPVVTGIDGDQPTISMRRVSEMSAREVRIAISEDGRLLEPAAQAEAIRSETKRRASTRGTTRPRGRQPSVTVDGDYIVIGPQSVRRDHLLTCLKSLGVI